MENYLENIKRFKVLGDPKRAMIVDKRGELTAIMNQAREDYPILADQDIQALSWVRYRNAFRAALYALADEVKKGG